MSGMYPPSRPCCGNSLFRAWKVLVLSLGKFLWSLPAEGLMGPEVVVVDHILEQLIGEVVEIVEGCTFDDIVVQGSPEALDLAVGLRPVGSGVAMLNADRKS